MTEVSIDQALAQAMQWQREGKLAEAEAVYRKVLAVQPNQPDALHMFGLIAANVGRLDLAEQLVRSAIAARPDAAGFHFNLGIVQRKAGNLDAAIQSYRSALRLDPNNAGAWYNLGNALQTGGQIQPAVEAYQSAIRIDPNHCDALINLGAMLQSRGQSAEAVEVLERAVRLHPDIVEAHNNLGRALTEMGQAERAIAACRKAVELNANYAEAHNNLASALLCGGEMDAAMNEYRRAAELKPDYALARCNLGMHMLMRGDFTNGWREFEWRRGAKEMDADYQQFPQPLWDGSPLTGKRILVQSEQGFGDAIHFARYLMLPQLREAKRVVFECYPELLGILGHIEGIETVSRGSPLPEFDVHIPLMSLPGRLNTRLETIPTSMIPYIHAERQKVEQWRERLAGESRRKVGFVWAGRSRHRNNRNRSLPLSAFEKFAEITNVVLISLQKGEGSEQAEHPPEGLELIDWTDELNDFSDTAALIENLDLVITVDTAMAHLAGAMGKRVWTLLPFIPDWRWLLNREDCLWYPSMRLIRQPRLGDWDSAIEHAAEMLAQFAAEC